MKPVCLSNSLNSPNTPLAYLARLTLSMQIDLEGHWAVRSLFPPQSATSQESSPIAVQIQKFEAQIEELKVTETCLTHDISALNETLARARKEIDSKQAELDVVRRKGKALLRAVEALADPDLA
jgi:uncharacterized coiled-coil protein SlyX